VTLCVPSLRTVAIEVGLLVTECAGTIEVRSHSWALIFQVLGDLGTPEPILVGPDRDGIPHVVFKCPLPPKANVR
jgi:hypothetical protein